ncbi:MAG: hypothetical protein ACPHID_08100 [Thermoplasmatota archaeon]
MRWMLFAAILLLAGCADDPSLLEEAEAAEARTVEAMGPDGSLARLATTMDMTLVMDGETMRMDGVFDILLHDGDAFTLEMAMDLDSETLEGTLTCTPTALIIEVAGQVEELENPGGTCLDADSADAMSFLSAFEGEDLGLSGLDMIPQTPAYTSVERQGSALVASFDQVTSIQGIQMTIEGTATILSGLVQSSTMALSGAFSQGGFDMSMDLSMDTVYHYGERTPLP